MSAAQLTDVIEIQAYKTLAPDLDLSLLRLWNSGIITQHPEFNRIANAPERSGEMIFWRDINMALEPNHSSTQPVPAVPGNTVQDRMKVYKAHLNQGWSSYNLTYDLTFGTDHQQHVRNRTGTYWAKYRQARLIAIIRGIIASNVAGSFAAGTTGVAGDMVTDISVADSTTATALNRFNSDLFSEAAFSMGDRQGTLGVMLVHSAVMNTMQKNQLIEWVQVKNEPTLIPTYRGRQVIVDDDCPHFFADPLDPSKGFKYISILFGAAAVGYGVGTHRKAVTVEEDDRTGHGGGSETLWERKIWLMHPFGFDNLGQTVTAVEGQQNLSDLQQANNWSRIVPRKAVPLSFMITNG